MDIKKILKNLKFKNNSYIILIVLVGIIFMLSSGDDDKKDTIQEKNDYFENYENYQKDIENLLSKISGAGTVDVLVTYYESSEKNIAYETNKANKQQKDGEDTKNYEIQTNSQAIMASGEPFVSKIIYPKIQGVIVATKGADDPLVRTQISDAVTVAFGIAPHKVCIVKKSE